MGMRSSTIIHCWFNTYDYEMRNYAPGLALFLMLAQRAAKDGLKMIDFGRGTEDYKLTFSNGSTELCEGSIELANSLAGAVRRCQKVAVHANLRARAAWALRKFTPTRAAPFHLEHELAREGARNDAHETAAANAVDVGCVDRSKGGPCVTPNDERTRSIGMHLSTRGSR
jgi:CelD/BcsL family acetyltransferase involved in cellulose biosynthesis